MFDKEQSLMLRKFNPELAGKEGHPVVDISDKDETSLSVFIGNDGSVVINWRSVGMTIYNTEQVDRLLRMAPLCFVEEKPVYIGDTVWNELGDKSAILVDSYSESRNIVIGIDPENGSPSESTPSCLTWDAQPKYKTVNILGFSDGNGWVYSCIENSYGHEAAIRNGYNRVPSEDRVATIEGH